MQNLTIDYSTDTNGRILSAAYNETGGFSGNLTFVYDNFGNVAAEEDDDGDMAKAVLINPNKGAIDTRYDPNDIDDPFSYRARDGFMGIGPLWANNDGRTVYMQGHVVIPNPWGNVSTNGDTTTTTTDDTTDKDGGDKEECCNFKDCCEKLLKEEHSSDYEDWMGEWDEAGYISGREYGKNGFRCNEALEDYIMAIIKIRVVQHGNSAILHVSQDGLDVIGQHILKPLIVQILVELHGQKVV